MHILFALPGLHLVSRGAEIAFESVAEQIAREASHKVTLVGSGWPRAGCNYVFQRIPSVFRDRFEHWPKIPFLRNQFMYEEATFAAAMLLHGLPDADITVTCSYPYVNWALRTDRLGKRSSHVFVTQNGDWAASEERREARFFSCDGLVCTNPLYFTRNRERWLATLIPNGVDPQSFCPGPDVRERFGLPVDRPIVLMVSALEKGKRVLEAMRAVAASRDAFLVIAGDGPLRTEVDRIAAELLPGRFLRNMFPRNRMPDLYRSADLFLHTKIRESFGNVYIEALSSGIPIVAHDDEVTRWILGKRAVLIDTTSEASVAAAIGQTLASNSIDTDEAAAWAHATYAWNVVANKYAEFFATVLEAKGRVD
jgi:glycosyltransferase involved in cell wall biosynthesis